jgi:hypothetical protein
VLSIAAVLSVGSAGITQYLGAAAMVQGDPMHYYDTAAYLFGIGPAAYVVEFALGALAMAVVFLRRTELEIVFALGILGSVMASPHMHELDYSVELLAAWLVLRTGPPIAHRLWLLAGVPACQFTALAIGNPLPELVWQGAWLAILGRKAITGKRPALIPVEPAP